MHSDSSHVSQLDCGNMPSVPRFDASVNHRKVVFCDLVRRHVVRAPGAPTYRRHLSAGDALRWAAAMSTSAKRAYLRTIVSVL